jgi:ABC-2 type transport system ATP-binding protein
VASLQPRVAGTVAVLGEPVVPGSEHAARHIGFTPDTPPLYDGLTVRDFLRFVAAGYDQAAQSMDTTIDFWLEKVWLADKARHKVRSLSRGMKQRLGIARTLLPNPTVILLDEPAAGLDPAGRVQFRQLLCDLREQGKTLIVSSHILADMEEYCTHIAIMTHGAVVQYGTVHEIARGVADGLARYTLELATPVADLAEQLAALPGVTDVRVERLTVTLLFPAGRERAAELLRVLVQNGVPLAGFSANAAGLEEAYLRAGIRQVD